MRDRREHDEQRAGNQKAEYSFPARHNSRSRNAIQFNNRVGLIEWPYYKISEGDDLSRVKMEQTSKPDLCNKQTRLIQRYGVWGKSPWALLLSRWGARGCTNGKRPVYEKNPTCLRRRGSELQGKELEVVRWFACSALSEAEDTTPHQNRSDGLASEAGHCKK
ncbi:hypothetical protein B0H19DRAFT_1068730 [Mycena capillaripes]|nr:hypothetical protein B0H19DRAFT_1068730 [Mycena capillaripes]